MKTNSKLRIVIALAVVSGLCLMAWSTGSSATGNKSGALNPATGASHTAAARIANAATVAGDIAAAQHIDAVPSNLTPALADTADSAWAGAPSGPCHAMHGRPSGVKLGEFGGCVYGDFTGKNLMIIYGDSHAGMWSATLQSIATRTGWSLRTFALPYCPPEDLTLVDFGKVNQQCPLFHAASTIAIRAFHPKLLVLTGQTISEQAAPGVYYTATQWEQGLIKTIKSLEEPGTRIAVIGNIPEWTGDDADCLAAHEADVAACMVPVSQGTPVNVSGEKAAAVATGSLYIDPTSWVCAQNCVPIVGNMRVFLDEFHFTKTYALFLSGVLEKALQLP